MLEYKFHSFKYIVIVRYILNFIHIVCVANNVMYNLFNENIFICKINFKNITHIELNINYKIVTLKMPLYTDYQN